MSLHFKLLHSDSRSQSIYQLQLYILVVTGKSVYINGDYEFLLQSTNLEFETGDRKVQEEEMEKIFLDSAHTESVKTQTMWNKGK